MAPTLVSKHWVVYLKPPFGGPEYVLQYLGRYTHRVAISNHRLVSFADGQVTFRWRDSAHHNEQKLTALSHEKFLRRFLCIFFRKASCVSGTSVSWPADGVARHCPYASNCWVRHKKRLPKNTLLPPKTFPIFIAVPSVEDQ